MTKPNSGENKNDVIYTKKLKRPNYLQDSRKI